MDVSVTPAQPGLPTAEVSIIVPARNEELSLGDCLQSLVAQTGVTYEIIVVDDGSTDRTREIAESFSNVKVVSAGPVPTGWTGKNNAVVAGVKQAAGNWLLFTDADTVHLTGSLARALAEAKKNDVGMLSYSPEQITVTFWEMATLPVVFAELARQYPPSKVSDPDSAIAAANGQYILIQRAAYEALGGHAAIASNLLEDVALARAVKQSGRKIRFRYGADVVRTRMYRSFRQLREGWIKNLALLFPHTGGLALRTLVWWVIGWGIFFFPMLMPIGVGLTNRVASLTQFHGAFLVLARIADHWWWHGPTILGPLFLVQRLRRANFTSDMEILGSLFGYPMFAYLLLRSKRAHEQGSVPWKGRSYSSQSLGSSHAGLPDAKHALKSGC